MKNIIGKYLMSAAFVIMTTSSAFSGNGTAEEAKSLLNKARSHFDSVGGVQAMKDFSDPKGIFVDRDLYVFCYQKDGIMAAHGVNPLLVGKNIFSLRDADGKPFAKDIFELAVNQGSGIYDYKWVNPVSKKIEQKSAFFQMIGEYPCGVGFYKN